MSGECFLAFDTSCYTTSVAAVVGDKVILDKRIMLEVEKGGRGLRQSEAVFQHIKNLKSIFLDYPLKSNNIKAVAYSTKPCDTETSYMPVFCVGESAALCCAATLGANKYPLTHQHGHIYSAFIDNEITDGDCCTFHVSGGTLDILKVNIADGIVTHIERIGGTLDITCGQLIDRAGVAAGLPFPSGAEIECIYTKGGARLAVNVKGLNTNLSGAETQALRTLEDGKDMAYVLSGVIDCVSETLAILIRNASKETGIKKFLFTGGVICNRIIREKIQSICTQTGLDYITADKAYSGDNACGLALAAEILYKKEKSIEDN